MLLFDHTECKGKLRGNQIIVHTMSYNPPKIVCESSNVNGFSSWKKIVLCDMALALPEIMKFQKMSCYRPIAKCALHSRLLSPILCFKNAHKRMVHMFTLVNYYCLFWGLLTFCACFDTHNGRQETHLYVRCVLCIGSIKRILCWKRSSPKLMINDFDQRLMFKRS